LPDKPRIGTGSPRRAAQLRLLRDDVEIVDIRGNVDTRLRMVTAGEVEAVVLARAGLARLGRLDVVTQTFDLHEVFPAPAQGALAVECRTPSGTDSERAVDVDPADDRLYRILTELDDTPSRAAVTAERALLSELEAG